MNNEKKNFIIIGILVVYLVEKNVSCLYENNKIKISSSLDIT